MALYLAIGRSLRSLHGKQEVPGSNPGVGLLSSLLPSPAGHGLALPKERDRANIGF